MRFLYIKFANINDPLLTTYYITNELSGGFIMFCFNSLPIVKNSNDTLKGGILQKYIFSGSHYTLIRRLKHSVLDNILYQKDTTKKCSSLLFNVVLGRPNF